MLKRIKQLIKNSIIDFFLYALIMLGLFLITFGIFALIIAILD